MRGDQVVDAATGTTVSPEDPGYAQARAAAMAASDDGQGGGESAGRNDEAQPAPASGQRGRYGGALRAVSAAADQPAAAAPDASQAQPAPRGRYSGAVRPVLPWQDPSNPLYQAAARGDAQLTEEAAPLSADPGSKRMVGASVVEGSVRPVVGWLQTLRDLSRHPVGRFLVNAMPGGFPLAETMKGIDDAGMPSGISYSREGGLRLDTKAMPHDMSGAMREGFERVREAYLEQDPHKLRSAVALLSEFGGNLPLYLPGVGAGEAAAAKVETMGGGKLLQRLAAGAVPGVVHGGLIGVGASAGEKDPMRRAIAVAESAAIGGLTGALGGAREHARASTSGAAAGVGVGAPGGVERRVAPALRGEVEELLQTLGGKTRPELAAMLDSAEPGSALEKAIERAADQLETPGRYARRREVSQPPPASADEAAARAAAFRARTAARGRDLGEPPGPERFSLRPEDAPNEAAIELAEEFGIAYPRERGSTEPPPSDIDWLPGRDLFPRRDGREQLSEVAEPAGDAYGRDPDAAIAEYAGRNLARIGEGANERPRGGVQEARARWMNRDAPLEDLGGEEMRHAVQRVRGAPEAAKTPLLHGIFKRDADGGFVRGDDGRPVQLARPAREILAGVDRRDLNVYMAATQDVALVSQGKPGTRELESSAALRALADKYGVDETPDGHEVKDLAARAREFRDWHTMAFLDPLIDVGRITEADKERMLTASQGAHAAMRKLGKVVAEEAEGGSGGVAGGRYQGKGNPVKRRSSSFDEKGGRNIDPVDEMVRQVYQVGIWTERQRVANKLAEMSERPGEINGIGNVVRKAPVQTKPIARLTVNDLREMGLPDDALDGMEDFSHIIYRASHDQPRGTFVSYSDGQPVYREAPEAVLRALEGQRPQTAGFIARLAQAQSRLVRAGAVFAPAFIGTNVLKDQATAFLFTPGMMYKPFWSAAKGLAEVMRKGDLYKEAVASGSLHGTLVSGDRAKMQGFIDEALGESGSWKRFANPVESLAAMSEALENGTRIGIFLEARKRGLSVAEARDLTREATIDFSRKGEYGEAVNRYSAFFNAGMQGLSKVYRSLAVDVVNGAKGDKAARARAIDVYAKGALAVTVPSILLWAKNHNDPDYKRIPQWEKDRMWHLFKVNPSKIPGVGGLLRDEPMWVTLPKPFELGWLFGSSAERMLDFAVDHDPRAVVEFLTDMVGQIAPDPTPNVVKPIAENVINKSLHFDRPIVPEYMDPTEGYASTSPTVMAAARLAGAAGAESVPGVEQLAHPLQLQNIVQGYTGGLGHETTRLADIVLGAAGVVGDRPGMPPRPTEVPVVGGFARGVLAQESRGSRSEPMDRFYEESKRIERLAGKLRRARERGTQGDRQGWRDVRDVQQNHPEYRFFSYTQDITKQLSGYNAQLRAIRADRGISPRQRAARERGIELAMSALAERALNVVEGGEGR